MVAIAATLLILPLVDLVIFSQWLSHHRVFRNLVGYTPGLMWVNFVWLLSIVFLPFPTKLIAEKSGYDVIISRHPNIVADDAPSHGGVHQGAITSILILAALGLAFTPLGLWSLLLLFLTASINRLLGRV